MSAAFSSSCPKMCSSGMRHIQFSEEELSMYHDRRNYFHYRRVMRLASVTHRMAL